MDKVNKKRIPLKITGAIIDLGHGSLRYKFRISPLVPNTRVYLFIRYCTVEGRDKTNKENERKVLARDLREKHRQCWERYHTWADEQ